MGCVKGVVEIGENIGLMPTLIRTNDGQIVGLTPASTVMSDGQIDEEKASRRGRLPKRDASSRTAFSLQGCVSPDLLILVSWKFYFYP